MGQVLIFLLSTISLGLSFDLHHVDPRTNVWLTWANRTGTTDFCLSLAQVSDPFRTCLIGYPYVHLDDFRGYVNTPDLSNVLNSSYWQWRRNNSDGWCIKSSDWPVEQGAMLQQGLIQRLNFSNHLPFQELTLWGSFPPQGEWENISNRENCSNMSPEILPVNGTGVVYFGDSWTGYLIRDGHKETLDSLIHYQNVSGNSGHWNISMNTGTRDVANITGQVRLPKGYFLICGDRAWPGIPFKPVGGPCYIGRLTLFAPHMRDMLNRSLSNSTRSKRSLRQLQPDCDDHVNLGSLGSTIALSLFLPGGMAASNWNKIKQLACWAVKEFNTTSDILSGLAQDVDSLRHVVLQNRAAIDFLLLAHGHGCQEFEGMCCMNLSDHSVSIHKQIAELRERIHNVQEGMDGLDGWLASWGITGWIKDLLKQGILILLVICVLLLTIPCILQCLQKSITASVNKIFLVQAQDLPKTPSTEMLVKQDVLELVGRRPWEEANV